MLLTALSKTSTSESVPQSLLFPGLRLTVQPQLDRGKVLTEAKKATGKLLVELQVRKSTADGAGAREFYTELTKPPPEWEGEVRDLVLKKKLVCVSAMALLISLRILLQPRKIFVQPNTFVENDEVVLKEYPLTPAGAIESFIERKL